MCVLAIRMLYNFTFMHLKIYFQQDVGYNYAKALFSTWVKKDLVKELFIEEQAGKLPDTRVLNVIDF